MKVTQQLAKSGRILLEIFLFRRSAIFFTGKAERGRLRE